MTNGEKIEIKLCNHGVGPAIFKSIAFSHGNSEFRVKNYNDYKVLFSSVGVSLEKISHKLASLDDQSALYQGTEVTLLAFEGTQSDNELHAKICAALSQLTLEIKYECIYGKIHTFKVKL
ncbi:hypothetical protein B0D95_04025 [Cellvibrio sp. PSBB023]|nr:hypothetical protein B0D95_04025 [Cellvibrio sp. PSBB023]